MNILDFQYTLQKLKINITSICKLNFDCILTNDGHKEFANSSFYDAIFVFGRFALARFQTFLGSKQPKRDPKQLWIAKSVESAKSFLDFDQKSPFLTLFNWTSGMSRKTTFYDPYVYIEKQINKLEMTKINQTYQKLQKDKAFCWMVSQCHVYNTRFETMSSIINNLHEPIHLWGSAAQKCMPKANKSKIIDHGQTKKFEETTIENIKKCKFYFAFENANCSDYVTEKFSNALISYAIPIVNGWRQSYENMLPGSFIHVSDFQNSSHLVSYLTYLLGNETAYLEYFEWRQNFRVFGVFDDMTHKYNTRCKVCQRVFDWKNASSEKLRESETIKNLADEFYKSQTCVWYK